MYIDPLYLMMTLGKCDSIESINSPNLKIMKEAAEEIKAGTIDILRRLKYGEYKSAYPEEYYTNNLTFFRPN